MDCALLLVDDEENILSSLTRLLRRDGYHILRATSGSAGLALLKTNDVGVIISDQRMPEMSGVEFLSQVKAQYPNTVRMVLSGYTDLNSVTDAINNGAIYKFLTKPWDDEQLRRNVREAFEHFNLRHENERLTHALQHANEELQVLNQDLERRVREQTEELLCSVRTLEVAQDIVEAMPMGILGISEDGFIAVANASARKELGFAQGGLVGTSLREHVSAAFLATFQQWSAVGSGKGLLPLRDGRIVEGKVLPLVCSRGNGGGWLLLLAEKVTV